jgi:hypothetical protein
MAKKQYRIINKGKGVLDIAPENLMETGDKSFVFDQGVVSAVWTIQHDLKKYPSIRVIDNGGTEVEGHIQDIDINNLTITFSAGFAGKAYLN